MRRFILLPVTFCLVGCPALAGLDVPPAAPDMAVIIARVEAMVRQEVPSAATIAPPGTATDSTTGTSPAYARADHTHATSVQRARFQVATAGTPMEWIFAKPYDEGVVPVVTCTAQAAANPTQPFVVNTVDAPTNTKASIIVFRAQTQTLTGTLLSLGPVAINLFAPAPAGTVVNCQAAKPTQ